MGMSFLVFLTLRHTPEKALRFLRDTRSLARVRGRQRIGRVLFAGKFRPTAWAVVSAHGVFR